MAVEWCSWASWATWMVVSGLLILLKSSFFHDFELFTFMVLCLSLGRSDAGAPLAREISFILSESLSEEPAR